MEQNSDPEGRIWTSGRLRTADSVSFNRIPEGEWGTLEVVSSLSLEERKHSDDHAGRMLHRGFRQRILRLGLWPLIPSIIQ